MAEDGFYKIRIDAKLAEKTLSPNRADIRLLDGEGNEVPYLIQQEVNESNKQWFKEYTLLSKTLDKGKSTQLIIHNPSKAKIDNFSLIVKNTTANKVANLSGSDDKANWFSISEEYSLNNMSSSEDVTVEKSVHFPLSNYEFFRLEISDSLSAPLNILKVGNYHSNNPLALVQEVPHKSLLQSDSAKLKQSIIQIKLGANQLVHRLKLTAGGPKFFKRSAALYSLSYDKKKLRKDYICGLEFSSESNNEFAIPETYGKEFLLAIENNDSPPLKEVRVTLLQNATSVVAYLNKGKQYHLDLGNIKAQMPQYDLDYFSQNIPTNIPQLQITATTSYIKSQVASGAESKSFFANKYWVWGILAVVIALLAYVTTKMLSEMGKKEGEVGSGE